jgi:hypothetical protein
MKKIVAQQKKSEKKPTACQGDTVTTAAGNLYDAVHCQRLDQPDQTPTTQG